MAEKITSPESKEVKKNNGEQHENDIERARKSLEKRSKHEKNETLEEIRDSVEKHAEERSETVSGQSEKESTPTAVSVSEKKQSYNQTMNRVRGRLSTPSRTFSRVIHAPVVEQASELAGKTVARPSGLLGGGIAAAIGLTIVFVIARRNGFALSGSEFILLLLIGFIGGLLFEATTKIFRRH